MTWIVGAAASLGYSVGISDVRVTFEDGSERDCLQKIYPMARFIAAGFAGSVAIGFTMLHGLASLLRDAAEDAAFFPQEVADCFAPLARDVFQSFSVDEQTSQSHLMLLGAHPSEDVGIPGYARCSVHILRSPEFVPQMAPIYVQPAFGGLEKVTSRLVILVRNVPASTRFPPIEWTVNAPLVGLPDKCLPFVNPTATAALSSPSRVLRLSPSFH